MSGPLVISGLTRYSTLLYSEAAASEEGGGGGGGDSTVHWSVVMSGVCGAVLLLGLVAVVGLSTYAYRHRHRARQRW